VYNSVKIRDIFRYCKSSQTPPYSIDKSTIEIEDGDEVWIGEFDGDILTIDVGYGEVEFVKQY